MSDVLQHRAMRDVTPPRQQCRDLVEGRNQAAAAPIPTYYDEPALKPSFYGWKVSSYIFLAGLGGSAQILATLADFADPDGFAETVRHGRYIALATAVAGAPLLILDLHTPQRFYNMLRIFRRTSPMSIGSYVLLGFGALSSLVAAAQFAKDSGFRYAPVETAAKLLQVPASLLGAAMSTYTGALLGATSTPLWAAAPRTLPAAFGAAAMSSAAAALSLLGSGAASPALDKLGTLASAAELVLLQVLRREIRGNGVNTKIGLFPVLVLSGAPLLRAASRILPPNGRDAVTTPGQPGGVGPQPTGRAAFWTSIAVLAGSFLLRHLILQAGNRSARRPRDHFRFASRR